MTNDVLAVTPAQLRAARALLGWNQQNLASRANVASSTVADFERGKRSPVANNLVAMRAALEKEGVTFLPGGAVVGPPREAQKNNLTATGKPIRLIDARDLSDWAERLDSKGIFPQLVHRLILAATGNTVKKLRFPSADSIQQEGWDGTCEQDACKNLPWLAVGPSGWELSTQRAAIRGKADGDYKKRTADPRELVSEQSTFVFATLKSWPNGATWALAKRADRRWADVRVIDADDLVHWIELYPSVGYWLASYLGKLPSGFLPLADNWEECRLAATWPLTSDLVLAGRDDEAINLLNWLRGKPSVRSVQADSPDDAILFLYASIDLLPEPDRSFYLMRCLRVFSAEAVRTLGASPSPLIVITEITEPGLASRIVQQGHHVLMACGSRVGIAETDTVLPRPTHEAFQSALEASGAPEAESARLTRDSVRSLTILRRLAPAASVKNPDWAEEPKARSLIPFLLAGGWDTSRDGDRVALEQLSGKDFDAIDSECTSLTGFPDAPLRHTGSAWKVASPRDAWFRSAGLIGRSDLQRFVIVAKSALGAADPRFEVPPDERWLAGIRGQLPNYSPWLLAGLSETLLLLAMFGDRVATVSDAALVPTRVVSGLLFDGDAQRWWSLSHQLRILAEAAPDAFLDAVERSLSQKPAPIMTLFQEDGGFLFGNANHSNLLRALETLAWSPHYLSRVSGILANLDELDPGGKWANRPNGSLHSIFLLWKPQTNATLSERIEVLDYLRKQHSDSAWRLMLSMLPSGYDTMMPTPQPKWRDFSTDKPEEVTYKLVFEGAAAVAKRLLEDAGQEPHRWVAVIKALANLSPEHRQAALKSLCQLSRVLRNDESRLPIWAALRGLLGHHRSFPDAQWTLPGGELDEIEAVYDRFRPRDLVHQRAWLFSDKTQLVSGQQGEDWNAREERILAKRCDAISELLSSGGGSSIRKLVRKAERPFWVGVAYAQQVRRSSDADEMLDMLSAETKPASQDFVRGLIAGLHSRFGCTWSAELLANAKRRKWVRPRILRVLLALPSERWTWDCAASFGPRTESAYWESAPFWPQRDDEEQTIYGIRQLLKARRAAEAVRSIAGSKQHLPVDLIIQMLTQAAEQFGTRKTKDNDPVMFQWSVCQLLLRLDLDPTVSEEQIARLEWTYLAVLEHSERPPVVLNRFMSRNPAFFVQVLSAVYRPHSESGTDRDQLPEHVKALALQAYRLIQSWNIVPGTGPDGIDGAALDTWVREAHKLAVSAERGAVGDLHIGRVLSFAPPDPDGIWPNQAVRGVIDGMKNDHLERGIVTGVHNKRGVTSRSLLDGGTQERELSKQYRAWADVVKFEWPRTAAVLEKIAAGFDVEASFHDQQVELTDWSYQ
jgi:transcriptional regulator with XRE-family HTH domain